MERDSDGSRSAADVPVAGARLEAGRAAKPPPRKRPPPRRRRPTSVHPSCTQGRGVVRRRRHRDHRLRLCGGGHHQRQLGCSPWRIRRLQETAQYGHVQRMLRRRCTCSRCTMRQQNYDGDGGPPPAGDSGRDLSQDAQGALNGRGPRCGADHAHFRWHRSARRRLKRCDRVAASHSGIGQGAEGPA